MPRRPSRRMSEKNIKDALDSEGRLMSLDQMGFTIEQFVTIMVYLQFNSVNPGAAADNSPKNHFGALVFSRYVIFGAVFLSFDALSVQCASSVHRAYASQQ